MQKMWPSAATITNEQGVIMNKEYDWNGLAIGDDVTHDKRDGTITDIYDKNDRLLAQVQFDDGAVMLAVPITHMVKRAGD